MAVSQNTWETAHDEAYLGMLGDSRPRTVETYEANEAIGFGVALVRVTGAGNEEKCQTAAGTSGADNVATNFLGINLRTATPRPSTDDPTEYQTGTNVSALARGNVWVACNGNVTAGQKVTFNSAGRLGSANPSASIKLIPGATWETSATSGELALVRISDFRTGA